MTRRMVRYTVHPEHAARNEELIRDVFVELHESAPAGLRYRALVLDDGVTFVHTVEHPDVRNPLPELAAFKRYVEGVLERCDGPPVTSVVRELGYFARPVEEQTPTSDS